MKSRILHMDEQQNYRTHNFGELILGPKPGHNQPTILSWKFLMASLKIIFDLEHFNMYWYHIYLDLAHNY